MNTPSFQIINYYRIVSERTEAQLRSVRQTNPIFIPLPAKPPGGRSPYMSTNVPITVLLAEDDIDDQELLQEALLSLDPTIDFHSFGTGRKFLEKLKSLPSPPELIILDYNIPEMNGAEILQQINLLPQYKSMARIVWSTSPSAYYKDSCLALGADAYFVKPSTLSGLKELARQMLDFVSRQS